MFYLIRHGETTFNLEGRMQGQMDVDLSDKGFDQAIKLSEHLLSYHADVIYSSPLKRAYQTAVLYQHKTHLPLILRDELKEIALGSWEGKTWKEINDDNHSFFTQSMLKDTDTSVHGGETLKAFQKRVTDHLYELAKKHDQEDVIIFTHGGNIRMILFHINGIDLNNSYDLKIDNASITTLKWHIDKKQFEIISINKTAHLGE